MVDSILTPGYQENEAPIAEEPQTVQYLEKDKFLSEFSTDEEKSAVRSNLKVPSIDNTYTKTDVDTQISTKVQAALQNHLTVDDPHGILAQVATLIVDMVKTDGSTPFTLPQSGVDPQKDQHLVTKKYADRLIKDHLNVEDPHNILTKVASLLVDYVKSSEVYSKSDVYTKQEVNNSLSNYVKRDGSTPFTKAQVGIDPEIDSHIATKRYVDKQLYAHIIDADPHNFMTILNNRLAYYAKKENVYDKANTYSRTQLDSIINNIVNQSVESSVQDFVDQVNDKLNNVLKQNYVKQDGSTPFISPQSGVDATDSAHLVTKRQLDELKSTIDQEVTNIPTEWISSGPTEATVGMVEQGTEFQPKVTYQELFDSIFYGKSVDINVPEYTMVGTTCPVQVCIHGSTSQVIGIELYQGEDLLYTFSVEDFANGCTTVDSKEIYEDTNFRFVVTYQNNIVHDAEATTKVSMPVFVGLLPKWKQAHTITMDYLQELVDQDTEGTQNRFLSAGNDIETIEFTYKFEDPKLRHPFIVVPADYPELSTMSTITQTFNIDAFDVISMIPLQVAGQDVIFKIYVYRQALSSLDQKVTFKFNKE